ncbi:hypothetical protein Vafri_19844, partial [Volvox africanus]
HPCRALLDAYKPRGGPSAPWSSGTTDGPTGWYNLGFCHENAVPYMVLFGEDELAKGVVVKIKDMDAHQEETVPLQQLVPALLQRLERRKGQLAQAEAAGGSAAAGEPPAATETAPGAV